MSEGREESKTGAPRYNRGLALCYAVHGVMVGGFNFLMVLINTQAARSAAEANAVVAAAILQPAPMFVTALALWCGWRHVKQLALFLPFFFLMCYLARFLGVSVQGGMRRPDYLFVAYFLILQARNLVGAIILAIYAALLLEPAAPAPH